MKKLFMLYFLILIILSACKGNDSPSVTVTDPSVPPVVIIEDPDDPIGGNIKSIVFTDSGDVKFFDGSGIYIWKNGHSVPGTGRKLTHENKLYNLDGYGNTESIQSLSIIPDFCVVDLEENVWTAELLEPCDPDYKYYFKVYKNNVYVKTLQENIVNMFLSGDDVIAVSSTGVYFDISGTKTAINYAGEFTVYDFNATTRTAKIDGVSVSWATNYFNGAKQWIEGYSWNGYTYLNNILNENASALKIWQVRANYPISLSENAVLISAGYAVFSGEKHLFFIECNSGWLFRYIPSSDTLETEFRLYNGDGYRDTGIYYSKILNPVANEDGVFFCFDDGVIYRYRFDSSQIGMISNYDGWIKGWK